MDYFLFQVSKFNADNLIHVPIHRGIWKQVMHEDVKRKTLVL